MCSKGNIKTNIFHNGLKLIYEPTVNEINYSTVYLYCNVGSVFETEKTHGFSHFVEHMCFKGTRKYPSYMNLYKYIDETGSNLNASTTKRYTVYTLKCNNEHLGVMLNIISDMIFNSIFNKKEYEKEIRVVIEENFKDDDDNYNKVFYLMDEILYKDTSFEFPIDSNKYHKKTPSIKDVKDFYNTYYKPHNMVLSICSNLSYQTIMNLLKKTQYWKKPAQPITEMENISVLYRQPKIYTNIQYKYKRVKTDVIYLCIGFKTCSLFDKDKYTLKLLKNILSGYFSSLLPLQLREKNGLTYSSDVTVDYYESSGSFVIDTVTEYSKLLKNGTKKGVLPIIIDIISELYTRGIHHAILSKGKDNLYNKMKFKLDNPATQTNHNGEHLLMYGSLEKYLPYCKIYDTFIKQITTADIHDVIKRYFKRENMGVSIVAEKIDISKIKHECEKIRII
jgi:predicted Zn-dependent peptidase